MFLAYILISVDAVPSFGSLALLFSGEVFVVFCFASAVVLLFLPFLRLLRQKV
jgi:hypothetical protein